jgi:signal transduction histidine kinase
LAQVLTRPTPAPHPILAIVDDDPAFFGNWATSPFMPVAPGDRVTLQWETAHSIGGSGPGRVEYRDLKPGSYFLRVATAKASGEPSGTEVMVPILVVPPLYQRWEAWLVVATSLAAATAWIGRATLQRRMQRQLAEMERQQALARERSRIARDLHDDIGAGLTEIAMQSDWVRRDLAQGPTPDTQRRIERVCQSAIALTRSVDEIVWAMNPANDTVDRFANYLIQTTEQHLDAAGLRMRLDIPQEQTQATLSGKVRHSLLLAVREALNNVIKHAGARLVRLEIRVAGNQLTLVVEDDGCGFLPEQAGAAGTHEGLAAMRQRMTESGGQFRLSSQPGNGTRVEFQAPLQS